MIDKEDAKRIEAMLDDVDGMELPAAAEWLAEEVEKYARVHPLPDMITAALQAVRAALAGRDFHGDALVNDECKCGHRAGIHGFNYTPGGPDDGQLHPCFYCKNCKTFEPSRSSS